MVPAWESRGLHVHPGPWVGGGGRPGRLGTSVSPRRGNEGALGQTHADELEEMENIKSALWQENQEKY